MGRHFAPRQNRGQDQGPDFAETNLQGGSQIRFQNATRLTKGNMPFFRKSFFVGRKSAFVLNKSPQKRLKITNLSGFDGITCANFQNGAKKTKICLIMSGKTWKQI